VAVTRTASGDKASTLAGRMLSRELNVEAGRPLAGNYYWSISYSNAKADELRGVLNCNSSSIARVTKELPLRVLWFLWVASTGIARSTDQLSCPPLDPTQLSESKPFAYIDNRVNTIPLRHKRNCCRNFTM
jgi:hypothetical protein